MASTKVYDNSSVTVSDGGTVRGIGKYPSGTTSITLVSSENADQSKVDIVVKTVSDITSRYGSSPGDTFIGTGYNWKVIVRLYSDSNRSNLIKTIDIPIKPYKYNGITTSWWEMGTNTGSAIWNNEGGVMRHHGALSIDSSKVTIDRTTDGVIYWYLTSAYYDWNPGYSLTGSDIVLDGRPNMALYEQSYDSSSYSSKNRPVNYGRFDTGYKKYSKATISISSTRPQTTASSSNLDISTSSEVVRVFYGASSHIGNTRIQFSTDGTNWTYPSYIYYGSSGTRQDNSSYSANANQAGYFEYKPSDRSIAAGKKYTLYVRRVHVGGSSYNSSNASKVMYTYTTVSLSNGSLSVNPVNANVNSTLSWSSWSSATGNSRDVCTCDVAVYANNKSTLIKSIDSGLSVNSKSYKFSSYVGVGYDNTQVQLRIVRTNTGSKESAAIWVPLTVRYKPIKQITDLNPSSGVNYLIYPANNSLSITWKYGYASSNQYGIVSGYIVELFIPGTSTKITKYISTSGSTTGSDSTISSGSAISYSTVSTFTVYTSSLSYSTYSISITPFYYDGTRRYNSDTTKTISSYIKKEARLNKPSITYPVSNKSWYNSASSNKLTTRVIIKLPTDPSVSGTPSSYRYEDIDVNINNVSYPYSSYYSYYSINRVSNKFPTGRYANYIIFNCSAVSIASNAKYPIKYNIKVRVKKDVSLIPNSNSYVWSEYSDVVSVNVYKFDESQYTSNSTVGSIVYDNASQKKTPITYVDDVVSNMCSLYSAKFTSNKTYNNAIISIKPINDLYTGLSNISSVVSNSSYFKSGDNTGVLFVVPTKGTVSAGTYVYSSDSNGSGYLDRAYKWIKSFIG